MSFLTDLLLILIMLCNLLLVGSSRLGLCVRILAVEGVLLGLITVLMPEHELARSVFLGLVNVGLKGVVFPWLLFRALRAAAVRREVEPFIGYSSSILLGVLMLGLSLALGHRLGDELRRQLGLSVEDFRPLLLLLPTALFTVLIGLFLIVSRKKALSQVMGYLVLENGIYLFGITLGREAPLLVEMGVSLDVFVAVFVMGIIIFHISREFDHIDVDQLASLKD
jgi:hydrogenase-4 component E